MKASEWGDAPKRKTSRRRRREVSGLVGRGDVLPAARRLTVYMRKKTHSFLKPKPQSSEVPGR